MSFTWTRPPENAFAELSAEYVRAIRAAIFRLAQRYAVEIEAWMKIHAPWRDITSNARQTLNAEAERLVFGMTEIILAHGVDYGIYLELAHGGAWAIIGPALDHFAPRIWQDVVRLLS